MIPPVTLQPRKSICRLLPLAGAMSLLASQLHAQSVVWSGNDPRNNAVNGLWSYGLVVPTAANGETSFPGDWSGNYSPGINGGPTDAYLGAPGDTICDVKAILATLEITPGSALDIEFGNSLTVATTTISIDGTMTIGGGGGGYPAFTNTGTLTKSAGTGTYAFDPGMTLSSLPGTTIAVAAGTLQLAGQNGLFDTVTFDPAAGTVIDLVNHPANSTASNSFQGTLTNGVGTGTVLLSGGTMAGTGSSQPCTLAFTGSVFQWTGGTIGGGNFTNTGVITLAGTTGELSVATFTNNGTMAETGAGNFQIGYYNGGGSFTNAAGAVFDLQGDGGVTGDYNNPFTNAGVLMKSAGTGTSAFAAAEAGSPPFVNTGTVAVHSGTLSFTGGVNDIVGTTLTEGTWTVDGGATLLLPGNPNGITVNQASVTLGGANTSSTANTSDLKVKQRRAMLSGVSASFPAINALLDNQGTFSLLAQQIFTTAGALSNEGTIALDAGSTLQVNGNFTASNTAQLKINVGGAASQGAGSSGVLSASGTVALGGTLAVTLASGAALPDAGDSMSFLSAGAGITGAFSNVPSGTRVATTDGRGSFLINYGANSNLVTVSSFAASGTTTHPAFFTGETALANGVYYLTFPSGNYFGYYSYLTDPAYIYHFDLGYEYVFDAADGKDGVYFYDFASSGFFYTSPSFPFPYLYDFTLKTVLYYYPDPTDAGHYNTDGVRYFYDFATGKIISK